MTALGDEVARQLAAMVKVDASIIGVYVMQSGDLAVVDVGNARITVPCVGASFPTPGDPVRLLRVGGLTILLGPSPRASMGRVSVAATGPAEALVEYPALSGVTKLMRVPAGLVLGVGDTVSIDWDNGGIVAAKYASAAPVVVPANPNPSPGGTFRQTFTAINSGSWSASGGWNQSDVWASDSYTGAWFYGAKVRDTIPDSATITAASIYLPIRQNRGAAPILGRHTSASKPSGNVTFASTQALSTRAGWVPVPLAWIDALKVGNGGLGFDHGGYSIWHGVNGINPDGQSGSLDITYSV